MKNVKVEIDGTDIVAIAFFVLLGVMYCVACFTDKHEERMIGETKDGVTIWRTVTKEEWDAFKKTSPK